MKHIIVRRLGVVLAGIFLLFQCIQGALHHFNNKRHHKAEYLLKKYHALSWNGAAGDAELVPPQESIRDRNRRQTLGGNPQAYTFNLYGDTHSFAQTFYSGEGSKVIMTA